LLKGPHDNLPQLSSIVGYNNKHELYIRFSQESKKKERRGGDTEGVIPSPDPSGNTRY
jgi:hypothetical protein